jgi:hypothetical protein
MNVLGVQERQGDTFHSENVTLTGAPSGLALAWKSVPITALFSYHHHARRAHAENPLKGPLMAATIQSPQQADSSSTSV